MIKMLAVLTAMIAFSTIGSSTVQAEMYKVAPNDIIPQYTYSVISKVLDPSKSFEDLNGLNLLIENTDIVAVYSNEGSNGNFVFQYMVELK